MNSCIYRGRVSHQRYRPRPHGFSYALFFMYLDLDELPGLFDRFWLWSARGRNLAWYCEADHLERGGKSLSEAVRDRVETATGQRPLGSVRLLTHLRYFGMGFNPVSLYYCYDRAGSAVQAVVAEVNNTPWGERHLYVLDMRHSAPDELMQTQCNKAFHVSPFMPIDMRYLWRLSVPGERLSVKIENLDRGEKVFEAGLHLMRHPLNSLNLAKALATYPFVTAKVVLAIYYEAARLWLKKTPLFQHPGVEDTPERADKL